nr:hypothetical protein [Thermus hydrothermalis]
MADPRAPWPERRKGLWLYALSLLALQGAFLLLLSPFMPRADHPLLWGLALLGGGWLLWLGERAWKDKTPLSPLVAAGFGASLAFFLGVMGLLLRPFGLGLWLLGGVGFYLLLRRAEAALGRGGGGGL